MSQFDIAHYVDFRPPRFLCPRCASIWRADELSDWPEGWEYDYRSEPEAWICGLCNLRFEITRQCSDVRDYLKSKRCSLEFEGLTDHLRVLARAAVELRSKNRDPGRSASSLRNLLSALNQARHFVHLVTWGLSWDFIGMLALLSHRVPVRAIVSQCDDGKVKQLLEARSYGGETFEVVPLPSRDSARSPHQKLIVIDGFLAISGSANLTVQAWRQVDEGKEQVIVETHPEKVWDLNNTLFSPHWQNLHPVDRNVQLMWLYPPPRASVH